MVHTSIAGVTSLADKKRALGLGAMSQTAVGLAALLPVAAAAQTFVYTPATPISSADQFGFSWDPYFPANHVGVNIWDSANQVNVTGSPAIANSYNPDFPLIMDLSGSTISVGLGCGLTYNVSWQGTTYQDFYGPGQDDFNLRSQLSLVSDGAVLNTSSSWTPDGSASYRGVLPAIPLGGSVYLGYEFTSGATQPVFGWIQIAHVDNADHNGVLGTYAINAWAINTTDGAITVGTSAIPEPASVGLWMGMAIVGVACLSRWRKRGPLA